MTTISPSGAPRRGLPGRTEPETPEEILGRACDLLRLCWQDAAIATVLLVLVAAGTLVQLTHAGWPGLAGQLLLAPVAGTFTMSAGLVVRSRRTLVSALSAVRAATGAPLDPTVPWQPFGLSAALDPGVRDTQLRRLLGAASRCVEAAWLAVIWALVSAGLFLVWTVAMVATGG